MDKRQVYYHALFWIPIIHKGRPWEIFRSKWICGYSFMMIYNCTCMVTCMSCTCKVDEKGQNDRHLVWMVIWAFQSACAENVTDICSSSSCSNTFDAVDNHHECSRKWNVVVDRPVLSVQCFSSHERIDLLRHLCSSWCRQYYYSLFTE